MIIMKIRTNINGRLAEYERKMMLPTKKSSPKKDKNTSAFHTSEENWAGKKRKKNGVYFKAPTKLPKPKDKNEKPAKRKSVKSKNFMEFDEEEPQTRVKRALHWGGTIELTQGCVTVQNTCTGTICWYLWISC